MRNPFGLLMAAFTAFWMFLCVRGLARALRAPDQAKWIAGLMYLLVLVGAGDFSPPLFLRRASSNFRVPTNGLLATSVGALQQQMASTLSRSCRQEGSRFTTPNGTLYGVGTLARAGVTSRFSVPQMA